MLIQLSTRPRARPDDLVDLLGECHERIRRFVTLARRAAELRHEPADQIARACADVERYFIEALPLHVADEEQSIAPRLRGRSTDVDEALAVMARQHRTHDSNLGILLCAAAEVRADPCNATAREKLADAARDLDVEFEEHLALEESVIFPAIRAFLSEETQAQIMGELRLRRRLSSRNSGRARTTTDQKEP